MSDPVNVLQTILKKKRSDLKIRKQITPQSDLEQLVKPSTRSFATAIAQSGNRFVLEYKRASPSRGNIRPQFSVDECIEAYEPCADAYSVLTDQSFFGGNHSVLKAISDRTCKPVLCKDFFIDVYQVFEARFFGADAILLMLSVVSDEQYRALSAVAYLLRMDVLTEVHTEAECQRAIRLNASIIGINNRNLANLTMDLSTTETLSQLIPDDRLIICESGIRDRADIHRLASRVDAFLVGTALMSAKDVALAAKKLVYGRVKICGVTTKSIVTHCFDSGASYVGFVFYPKSKRYIDPLEAAIISRQVKGCYVGVFVNETLDVIVNTVIQCQLTIVQLHGEESVDYIALLRSVLPQGIHIWKAIPIASDQDDKLLQRYRNVVDNLVLDCPINKSFGGNGIAFDWQLLPQLTGEIDKDKLVIAGGVDAENVAQLFCYHDATVDLSSAMESLSGEKDRRKISAFFNACRTIGRQPVNSLESLGVVNG